MNEPLSKIFEKLHGLLKVYEENRLNKSNRLESSKLAVECEYSSIIAGIKGVGSDQIIFNIEDYYVPNNKGHINVTDKYDLNKIENEIVKGLFVKQDLALNRMSCNNGLHSRQNWLDYDCFRIGLSKMLSICGLEALKCLQNEYMNNSNIFGEDGSFEYVYHNGAVQEGPFEVFRGYDASGQRQKQNSSNPYIKNELELKKKEPDKIITTKIKLVVEKGKTKNKVILVDEHNLLIKSQAHAAERNASDIRLKDEIAQSIDRQVVSALKKSGIKYIDEFVFESNKKNSEHWDAGLVYYNEDLMADAVEKSVLAGYVNHATRYIRNDCQKRQKEQTLSPAAINNLPAEARTVMRTAKKLQLKFNANKISQQLNFTVPEYRDREPILYDKEKIKEIEIYIPHDYIMTETETAASRLIKPDRKYYKAVPVQRLSAMTARRVHDIFKMIEKENLEANNNLLKNNGKQEDNKNSQVSEPQVAANYQKPNCRLNSFLEDPRASGRKNMADLENSVSNNGDDPDKEFPIKTDKINSSQPFDLNELNNGEESIVCASKNSKKIGRQTRSKAVEISEKIINSASNIISAGNANHFEKIGPVYAAKNNIYYRQENITPENNRLQAKTERGGFSQIISSNAGIEEFIFAKRHDADIPGTSAVKDVDYGRLDFPVVPGLGVSSHSGPADIKTGIESNNVIKTLEKNLYESFHGKLFRMKMQAKERMNIYYNY